MIGCDVFPKLFLIDYVREESTFIVGKASKQKGLVMLGLCDFVEEAFDSDFCLTFIGLVQQFDEIKNIMVLRYGRLLL